jgi:serine/threonine protein kinase
MLTHDATNTDALPLLDERIDKYTLLREIGRGGMGVVYEAAQDGLDRHVAIKVCLQSNARFSREANTTARLDHPNIVSAFEFGESNGITWLVMPLVNGVSLDNVRALKRDQDLKELFTEM